MSPNAAELPAPGSAQLIVASPDGVQPAEPVLVDWLLLDAPLQHLRDDDAQWRLRISVNGDSFLVDRQNPLWLKGFRRGSNAVQLELLDGRGDPLNPPFNSLVREVVIGGSERPAWLRPSLSAEELAVLSGEQPAEPSAPAAAAAETATAAETQQPASAPVVAPEPDTTPEPSGAAAEPSPASTPPLPEPPTAAEAQPQEQPEEQSQEQAEEQAELQTEAPSAEPSQNQEPPQATPAQEATSPAPPSPLQATTSSSERLAPSTSLGASARDLVNADGSLQQPKARGPLAGLREKLGG